MNPKNRTDAEESVAKKSDGKWNQVKGNVKEAWGDITNDPATRREGQRDRIKGRIEQEYGRVKEKESDLERDLDDIDRGTL